MEIVLEITWEIAVPKEKMGGQVVLCGGDESCDSCPPVTEFSHYNGPQIYLPIAFNIPICEVGVTQTYPLPFRFFAKISELILVELEPHG